LFIGFLQVFMTLGHVVSPSDVRAQTCGRKPLTP
jgi:hypothetical protein